MRACDAHFDAGPVSARQPWVLAVIYNICASPVTRRKDKETTANPRKHRRADYQSAFASNYKQRGVLPQIRTSDACHETTSPVYEQSTTYTGCDDINNNNMAPADMLDLSFLEGLMEEGVPLSGYSMEGLDEIERRSADNADVCNINDLTELIASVEDDEHQCTTSPMRIQHQHPTQTPLPLSARNALSRLAAMIPVVSHVPMAIPMVSHMVSHMAKAPLSLHVPRMSAIPAVSTAVVALPKLTKEQRKTKIERYLAKRKHRVWGKTTNTKRQLNAAKRARTDRKSVV